MFTYVGGLVPTRIVEGSRLPTRREGGGALPRSIRHKVRSGGEYASHGAVVLCLDGDDFGRRRDLHRVRHAPVVGVRQTGTDSVDVDLDLAVSGDDELLVGTGRQRLLLLLGRRSGNNCGE